MPAGSAPLSALIPLFAAGLAPFDDYAQFLAGPQNTKSIKMPAYSRRRRHAAEEIGAMAMSARKREYCRMIISSGHAMPRRFTGLYTNSRSLRSRYYFRHFARRHHFYYLIKYKVSLMRILHRAMSWARRIIVAMSACARLAPPLDYTYSRL